MTTKKISLIGSSVSCVRHFPLDQIKASETWWIVRHNKTTKGHQEPDISFSPSASTNRMPTQKPKLCNKWTIKLIIRMFLPSQPMSLLRIGKSTLRAGIATLRSSAYWLIEHERWSFSCVKNYSMSALPFQSRTQPHCWKPELPEISLKVSKSRCKQMPTIDRFDDCKNKHRRNEQD